ncbi:hypothetical protein L7F22_014767 [Adiantum nelumboides]|nr:hypothetical protein [Adiantum nelumboides]
MSNLSGTSSNPLLKLSFAHENITQTALQQLNALCQQQHEPVNQFAVKMNQLLLRANAAMSEEMKLFFLWTRLRHDLSRRVRDQDPTTFHAAIQIAQRIKGATQNNQTQPSSNHILADNIPTPMDIDVQSSHVNERRPQPT